MICISNLSIKERFYFRLPMKDNIRLSWSLYTEVYILPVLQGSTVRPSLVPRICWTVYEVVVWADCSLGVVALSASSVVGGFLCSKMSLMKKERILLDSGVISFMFRFESRKHAMIRTRIKWQHSSNVGEKIWMKENVFVYKRKLEFTQVSMIDMVLRPYRILILSALWFPFMIKQTSPNQTSKWLSNARHAYSTARMKLFKIGVS